jgi:hypothetical protein
VAQCSQCRLPVLHRRFTLVSRPCRAGRTRIHIALKRSTDVDGGHDGKSSLVPGHVRSYRVLNSSHCHPRRARCSSGVRISRRGPRQG